jgi:hypothetical protein
MLEFAWVFFAGLLDALDGPFNFRRASIWNFSPMPGRFFSSAVAKRRTATQDSGVLNAEGPGPDLRIRCRILLRR